MLPPKQVFFPNSSLKTWALVSAIIASVTIIASLVLWYFIWLGTIISVADIAGRGSIPWAEKIMFSSVFIVPFFQWIVEFFVWVTYKKQSYRKTILYSSIVVLLPILLIVSLLVIVYFMQ